MAKTTPIKGRGARSNATSRYIADKREAFDDGWEPEAEDDTLPRLDTQLRPDHARKIISTNDSPDIGFDRSINPYKGCEHGCIYCYARPNHAYLGLSPGQDFETRIFFKPEAARLLEAELSARRYRPKLIHIGGDTDPYQPAEKSLKITRSVLEVMDRFNHPVSIITKSHLITRDVDILGRMARRNLAGACISITTLDRTLARDMEPRAATPQRRLDAIRTLSEAGVPVMVGFAPVIPGLNDQELEAVLEAAAQAGATRAMFVTLRLPLEIKDLFREWLADARPDRASKIMSLIRQARGGRDYDPEWGSRMRGSGPVADLIAQRFAAACRRHRLNTDRVELDLKSFRVPPRPGDQLGLFDAA
ncbi:MAG: PA0069 family radical SAM protein [Caulobacterales bacterium]|nr:PA0069 family radical SAM protein [Caulobacterales bacterium]